MPGKYDDDIEEEYRIDKPICCSVKTFLVFNYIWAVISIGLLAVGVSGVVVNSGVLVVLPPQAYFALIAFGAFGLLVIFLGIIGQKVKVELCFLLYILFVSLGLIAQTLAFCFLLLYANDVGTIASLDTAAINAQESFENNLVEFAETDADRWKETQDRLDCCGIDFELGLDEDVDIDAVETGDRCESGAERLEDLRDDDDDDDDEDEEDLDDENNFDEFGNFLPALEDEIIGVEQSFFCKHRISEIITDQTPVIAALLSIIVVVRIIALVSASRMYWVPEFLGGWQFDEEERDRMVKRKGLQIPKTAEDYGGNRVLSTIRAQTSSLSFRVRNAVTPDPEVPRTAGILKRYSMKHRPAQTEPTVENDGEFVGLKSGPMGGTQNPVHTRATSQQRGGNMFQRFSSKIFKLGGSGFIDMSPPPGLPQPSGRLPPSRPDPPADN